MAKVVLIGMYDAWVIGLRNLANTLIENDHSVTIVHFKMMANKTEPFYLKNTLQYQTLDTVTSREKILINSYNTDVRPWSHSEMSSMGDLLVELQPDIIGLSTRSVYHRYIIDITEQMKRVPDAVTVAGGHDASFRPEFYIDHMDYACVGEGEDVILQMAESVDTGDDLHQIPNLVYRHDGRVVKNPLAPPCESKDHFFSERFEEARHFVCENNRILPSDPLLRNIQNHTQYYYTMVGRGCTGRCAYCTAGHFQGLYLKQNIPIKSRRMRPIARVVRELQTAKAKGFQEFTFLDSFLVAPKQYLLDFFDAYGEEVGLPFFAQLHPEQVLSAPEILEAAHHAGMSRTVVGIQSGSEQVNRKVFNRHTSHEKLLKFAEMMVGRGNLRVDYHIVTHNPFDAPEDFEETLSLIDRLPKINTSLFLFRLYAFVNTRLHRLIQEQNPDPLDIAVHDKRALLCLIRFVAPDTIFESIRSHFDQLGFEDLRQLYMDLKKQVKTDVDWVGEGKRLMNQKKLVEAMAAYDRALALDPGNYGALVGKGWGHMVANQPIQAEWCFKEALAKYPLGTRKIWHQLGSLSLAAGRLEQAVEYLSRAKFLTSPYHSDDYGKILIMLANAQSELGKVGKTRDLCAEALGYLKGGEKDRVAAMKDRLDTMLSQGKADTPKTMVAQL